MGSNKLKNKKELQPECPRLRAWSILVATMLCIWIFAIYIGPWLEGHIPMMGEIVKVVEEQDINANAYFYTEIEASSDGEQFLRDSFELANRDDYGLTYAFLSGILICLLILFFGFWLMPLTNNPSNNKDIKELP